MADTLLPFLLFPAVGALIGALTNQLAIRMLFRPYKPVFLGRWKLPLTPGVIPSQRETIATNIAATFEANLLSGQDLHAMLTGPKARRAIENKIDEMLADLGPFANFAKGFKPTIVNKIVSSIEELATNAIQQGGDLNLRQKIEERINTMDIRALEDLILGFSSRQFRYITWFGGLIGAVIGLIQAAMTLML